MEVKSGQVLFPIIGCLFWNHPSPHSVHYPFSIKCRKQQWCWNWVISVKCLCFCWTHWCVDDSRQVGTHTWDVLTSLYHQDWWLQMAIGIQVISKHHADPTIDSSVAAVLLCNIDLTLQTQLCSRGGEVANLPVSMLFTGLSYHNNTTQCEF